jgi:uncharacterized membrane protein (DUF485 family)
MIHSRYSNFSRSEPYLPTFFYNNENLDINDNRSYVMLERNKIRLHKGIFTILLINIIVTIFILTFFVKIINPTIVSAVKGSLRGGNSHNTNSKLFEIINVLKKREYKLIDKNNSGTYYIIAMEILGLFCFLLYVYKRILILNKDTRFMDTFIIAGITIMFLLGFQLIFFNFGLSYQYMGKYGSDEALYRFVNNIITDT